LLQSVFLRGERLHLCQTLHLTCRERYSSASPVFIKR
jgi:hypothetical protein